MFQEMKNMTFSQYIKSYSHLASSFNRYKRTYKNYFHVMQNLLRKNFPINAVLKNGQEIKLKNYYETYLTSFGIFDEYNIENNIIEISRKNFPRVKIDLGENNGDVYGVFFEEIYDFLPVKNKTVIDIGANIGDSSIYFALKGAKQVIALEPIPNNFNLAEKNIALNNLTTQINLLLAGCSDKKGHLVVDQGKMGAGSSLTKSNQGLEIPLMTIEEILSIYHVDSPVLKLDCEGCEYDSILNSKDSLLRKFSHIQIEYHYGYQNLKNKLEKCGFHVEVTEPYFIRNRQAGKSMFCGYIYAKQID